MSEISNQYPDDLLAICDAKKAFRTPEGGYVRPLDGISLSIRNNEFLTLLGPSGCGKTTLLKAIAGFEDLDNGEMYLDGEPIGSVPAHRRPFNTVFQNYALFPHLSVAENVGYGLSVAGVPKSERVARVAEALRLVSLAGLEQRQPAQLSGGQQQRVALARALVNRPRILLLDEPLSALDRKLRQSMQIELKNLQHTVGITFLFVTHDQEEALSMSDRIAVMDRGKVLQLGTPAEIYDVPSSRFVASFIGTSNILSGTLRRQGGEARVQVTEGIAIAITGTPAGDGEPVDVVLRPEHLILGGGGPHRLMVTLENIVFVGSDLHLHARLANGELVVALHRHARGGEVGTTLAPGSNIELSYDARLPHVMARRSAAR